MTFIHKGRKISLRGACTGGDAIAISIDGLHVMTHYRDIGKESLDDLSQRAISYARAIVDHEQALNAVLEALQPQNT